MSKNFSKVLILFLVLTLAGCKHYSGGPDAQEKNEREILGFSDGENPRIKEIQLVLNQSGFNSGPEDGRMKLATRRAIREFQSEQGLDVTGYVDPQTLLNLQRMQKLDPKERRIAPKKIVKDSEVIPKSTPPSAKISPEKPARSVKPKKISKFYPRTLRLQKALKKAGFDPGPMDGKNGVKTQKAVLDFQKAHSLKPDGIVGPATLKALEPFFDS